MIFMAVAGVNLPHFQSTEGSITCCIALARLAASGAIEQQRAAHSKKLTALTPF